MVSHSILRIVPMIVVCIGILSCAALGTKVQVLAPEALSSIKTVAIWPVAEVALVNDFDQKFPEMIDAMLESDINLRSHSEDVSKEAEAAIKSELTKSGLFRVIGADSLAKLIRGEDPAYERFPKANWDLYRGLVDADAMIVTDLSFKRQGGGVNTYATLTLYDRDAEVVMEVKFNTQWGKSYAGIEDGWATMPDAVHGAAVGLIKSFRSHLSADSTAKSK